jgi:lysozyme
MNTERLMKQLKKDEGIRVRAYNDSLGYKTVGVGHLIKKSDPDWLRELEVGDKITMQEVEELFISDLSIAIHDAMRVFAEVWDDFPDMAQEVFINMIFNLGVTRFLKFKKTILYAYAMDWDKVASEMLDSKWAKQVGQRAYRLSAQIERM